MKQKKTKSKSSKQNKYQGIASSIKNRRGLFVVAAIVFSILGTILINSAFAASKFGTPLASVKRKFVMDVKIYACITNDSSMSVRLVGTGTADYELDFSGSFVGYNKPNFESGGTDFISQEFNIVRDAGQTENRYTNGNNVVKIASGSKLDRKNKYSASSIVSAYNLKIGKFKPNQKYYFQINLDNRKYPNDGWIKTIKTKKVTRCV